MSCHSCLVYWLLQLRPLDRGVAKKASSTADLAAFSLIEPIWNFDNAALQGIANAIMMDSDIHGIRVIKNGSDTPDVERVRTENSTSFDALLSNRSNLVTTAKINRQGEEIALVQFKNAVEMAPFFAQFCVLIDP